MEIFNLLKSVTETLHKLKIPYMLTGSIAMNFYAISRATRDIDIVINMQEKDVDGFVSGYSKFYFNKETIVEEIRRKGMFNIIDTISGFKVDMILLKDNEYAAMAFERRILFNDLGFSIFTCSVEDLVIAKLQWIQQLYSDRQANDIQMLLQTPGLDTKYLMQWCVKLKLNTYKLFDV
jgi:hypothetical protein